MAEIGGRVIACQQKTVVGMWVFHGSPLQLLWVSRSGITRDVADVAKWQHSAHAKQMRRSFSSHDPTQASETLIFSLSFYFPTKLKT